MTIPNDPELRKSWWEWLKRKFGLSREWKTLRALNAHNDRLGHLLSNAGKRELDQLVIFEAAVLARIKDATRLIEDDRLDELLERSGIRPGFVTREAKEEIRKAAKEEGFIRSLYNKAKSVANEKVKRGIGGLLGGGD